MDLTKKQKQELFEKGYVTVPGLVPEKMSRVALRAINHSLGKGMDLAKVAEYRADSYCPELRTHHAITDLLYKTRIWPIAESLLEPAKVSLWGGGQIALRFPSMEAPGDYHPHIDGMYRSGNKIPKGDIQSFTMLAGVLLSDTPNRYWGNFTVWPESHRILQQYFQKHGSESLRKGLPPVRFPQPQQIAGRCGDVILCHYQTAHTAALNVSPYIRYAVFFRLKHSNHGRNKEKVFTNIWLEWPGLISSLDARAGGA